MSTLAIVVVCLAAALGIYVLSVLFLVGVLVRSWDDMPQGLLVVIGMYAIPAALWMPGIRKIVNSHGETCRRKLDKIERTAQIKIYGREVRPGEMEPVAEKRYEHLWDGKPAIEVVAVGGRVRCPKCFFKFPVDSLSCFEHSIHKRCGAKLTIKQET